MQYSVMSLLFSGCHVEYSPYRANTEKQNRNINDISAIQANAPQYPFSIALISDSHAYYDELKGVFNKIKSDQSGYAFVIHGGDITDAGLQTEYDFYNGLRDALSLACVHSIGNHDALTNGLIAFRNIYGPFDFTFQVAQTHFIFFNNNTWEFGNEAVDLDWLEAALVQASSIIATQGGQIIVVNHINHDSSERFSQVEITRYRDLLSIHQVTLSINGHNHGHLIQTFDTIEYLTIGSVSEHSFMKLTLSGPNQFDYTLEQIHV